MSQKILTGLVGCGICSISIFRYSIWPIFKTEEILIHPSDAYLDVEILLGEMIHIFDPEIRKMLTRSLYAKCEREFHCPYASMAYLPN